MYHNNVWSLDVVEARSNDGRRLLSRRCLAIYVAHRINALDVIETLADVMLFEGIPAYIRSDNDPEMIAKALRQSGCQSWAPRAFTLNPDRLGKRIPRVIQWQTEGRTAQ